MGGIEGGSRNLLVVHIENRNVDTITPVLRDNLHSGTTVFTDMWRAYNVERIGGLQHQTIYYTLNFVDSSNPAIHIRNIEVYSHALSIF